MSTDQPSLPQGHEDLSSARQMSEVLKSKYGEDASAVAARQLEMAAGDNRARWEAIVALLTSNML